MYVSQLEKHLQKERLKPVYAAFGNNPFEIHEVVTMLRERAARDGDAALSVTEFSRDRRELADVMDALQGAPMFAPYAMVILQDADEFVSRHRKPLEAYLEHPSPTGVLVMTVNRWAKTTRLAKMVQEIGGDVSCWAPRGHGELLDWTRRRCRGAHGKTIDASAAELLVELCQEDLPAIDAELKKLALYVGEAAGISESDVAASAMSYGAYKPFDVCDKLAAGDRRAALKVVEGLLDEGLPAPVLVGTLRSHFRRLLEARLVADRDGVAAAVSQFARFPKEQDGFRRQLSQFSADDLVRAYGRLLEADLQSKTSRFPDTIIIERLILDLSAPGQGTPSRPRT